MAKKELNLGGLLESVTDRVEEANVAQEQAVEQEVSIDGKLVPYVKIENKPAPEQTRKGPKSGTVGRGHVINANLDDEVYWRADTVKKRLNKDRVGDQPFVSINTLLCNALEIWLDQNYPETRNQYRQLKEMGVL